MLLSGLITAYFIRHGQAGIRQDYDRLSDLGRQQSIRLGAWLARRPVLFEAACSGRLKRQRETADLVRDEYRQTGVNFPELATDPCWDEFDLDAVYRGIAPQIASRDEEFRRRLEELEQQARNIASPVHHTWTRCDTTVVRAWIDGFHEYEGESFEAFVKRVRGSSDILSSANAPCNVAIFTSATPAAIWTAAALDLDGHKIMQLAGVTYNTAVTVIRIDGKMDEKRIRLLQFNTVPHLEPELLTYR
jgi:broad specificity phosphatase PhoE